MLDLDEMVTTMARSFTTRDIDPFAPDDDDPEEVGGLPLWSDDDEEPFWTDPDFQVQDRAEIIHGVEPQPEAAQRALDIHGVGSLTRHDFVSKMLKREGGDYEWGGTTRDTGWDCSGIIYRIMQNNGFTSFPRTSGEIIDHATPISLEKAIRTSGAVLWHEGHIAVSLGNGKTIEAMGEDYGVVKGNAEGRFTRGGLLPETPSQGKRPKVRTTQPKRKPKQKAQTLAIDPASLGTDLDLTPSFRMPMAVSKVVNELPAKDEAWGTSNDYAALAKVMAAKRGWTGKDWRALNLIIDGGTYKGQEIIAESHWDPNALNPSSGATGIPQLNPNSHQIPENWDDPKVQIQWMLDYVDDRYGTPRAALQFKLANGWY